jgi:magnesium chelatase family protein
MNPCPCGYLGHYSGRCECTPGEVAHYRSRISGPLLDRIDMRVEVPALKPVDLIDAPPGESSSAVRMRVARARDFQRARQGSSSETPEARSLLRTAIERLGLSGRGHHRVQRVARTIADLESAQQVDARHVGEALGYRET